VFRAAVIGAGKISEEHLGFLGHSAVARPVAVCDLSPALAQYAVERFGVEQAFTSHREMLERVRPDVVHVLTPPHTHCAIVEDCLSAGAHVIVEKPIAPTNLEFRRLWRSAQRAGVLLLEDHNYKFNDAFLAVRSAVEAGRIGDVEEVDVRVALPIYGGRYADANLPHPSHRLPGGVLHEYLTHMAYMALAFLPRVDRVEAIWSRYHPEALSRFDDLHALVVGGTVHARLRFSARTSPHAVALAVRGSRGWIETDIYHPYVRLVTPRGAGPLSPWLNQLENGYALMRWSVVNLRDKLLYRKTYHGLHRLLQRAYSALAGDGESPVSFEDMDRATSLIDRLVQAQGQPA
jgi:predicted dehydrogenase